MTEETAITIITNMIPKDQNGHSNWDSEEGQAIRIVTKIFDEYKKFKDAHKKNENAWEFCRLLTLYSNKELANIFFHGVSCNLQEVLLYSFEDAKEKYDSWQKTRIKLNVGDSYYCKINKKQFKIIDLPSNEDSFPIKWEDNEEDRFYYSHTNQSYIEHVEFNAEIKEVIVYEK